MINQRQNEWVQRQLFNLNTFVLYSEDGWKLTVNAKNGLGADTTMTLPEAVGGGGTVTSVAATAPIVATPNPIVGAGTISHAASGVTPAAYGDATHVPQLTVDSTGHVTSASNVAISAGGSGTVTSIAATAPISVTPNPIVGTGTITHDASGVSAATYGDSTHVAQVAVDAKGHVTSASNVAIPSNTGTTTGDSWFWGSGRDGSLHFDGTTAVVGCTLSVIDSQTYLVQRNLHAANILIDAGVNVTWNDQNNTACGGAQIFCTGTLTVNGALHNDGLLNPFNARIGGLGGGQASNMVYGSGLQGGGGGNPGAGSNGTSATLLSWAARGGAGGAGNTGNAGGAAGTLSIPADDQTGGDNQLWVPTYMLLGRYPSGSSGTLRYGGGTGGGGGGSGTAGIGGGGGGGAGVLGIFARNIAGSGRISCNGGNGNVPGGPNGGAGGGGGGGLLLIITSTSSIPCTVQANGGTKGLSGGAGGNGVDGSAGMVAKLTVATLN